MVRHVYNTSYAYEYCLFQTVYGCNVMMVAWRRVKEQPEGFQSCR